MDSQSTAIKLPDIIRLPYTGLCGCGEQVPQGERVGYIWTRAQVVCLYCMARLQTRRIDPAQARHTELVAERANGLMARLIATRTLGTVAAELRPVDTLADRASRGSNTA